MTTINLDLPDTILESYQQNLPSLSHDIKQAFIIWEYLSGHLSLKQSAEVLELSYRGFVELLCNRSIAIDALNEHELETQCNNLRELLKFNLTLNAKGFDDLQKKQPLKRQAGLGKGSFWISADFDEPLPDNFWLGDE
jgi:predicted HTH domain antitoxin